MASQVLTGLQTTKLCALQRFGNNNQIVAFLYVRAATFSNDNLKYHRGELLLIGRTTQGTLEDIDPSTIDKIPYLNSDLLNRTKFYVIIVEMLSMNRKKVYLADLTDFVPTAIRNDENLACIQGSPRPVHMLNSWSILICQFFLQSFQIVHANLILNHNEISDERNLGSEVLINRNFSFH